MDTREDDGRHDFDSRPGRWNARYERLKHRFVGSTDREHSAATQACPPMPGGPNRETGGITHPSREAA